MENTILEPQNYIHEVTVECNTIDKHDSDNSHTKNIRQSLEMKASKSKVDAQSLNSSTSRLMLGE